MVLVTTVILFDISSLECLYLTVLTENNPNAESNDWNVLYPSVKLSRPGNLDSSYSLLGFAREALSTYILGPKRTHSYCMNCNHMARTRLKF